MLELILEVLLNGLGELILEILGATKAERHPVGRAIIWTLFGVLLGAVSAWAFPQHFIHAEGLRLWNLAASPAFVGSVSGLIAKARRRPVLSPAGSAALFALAFAVTRWKLAT